MVRVHHRHGGYTSGQAALVLGVKLSELAALVAAGKLPEPTRTPGGQLRYDLAAVNSLAEE
jgi:hypothetical protein